MNGFQTTDINQLANLLNLNNEENSDDELDCEPIKYRNPYLEQESKYVKDCDNKELNIAKNRNHYAKLAKSKDIWSDDEVLNENCDWSECKEKPSYEMVYQQKVTPNDIFLQLDGKGPGSNSCECLIVKIKLDETNSSEEISLKISELALVCKTEKYHLNLDLPKHVNPENSTAKWNQSCNLLEVKLSLQEQELKL